MQEKEVQRRKMWQAKGWFGVDEEKMREAMEMRMEGCERLKKYGVI